MAARTTRREARERIIKSFMESLDKIIPAEESVPLRGQTFLDWEQQADAMRKAVLPTLLQERAALDVGAEVAGISAVSVRVAVRSEFISTVPMRHRRRK